MNPLTTDLLQGTFTWPNALINESGPLPIAPPGQMGTPDGLINKADQTKLLQNGLMDMIYSYGPNPARITTQTQNNIPNKVQRIIAKIFIPSAQTEAGTYQDPILEHATTDGDLVFTLKINRHMAEDSTRYVLYPAGYSHGAVKLINLATLNYLLWGLQVGTMLQGGNSMWLRFFNQLCKADHQPLLSRLQLGIGKSDEDVLQMVWNFIRSYISPYGIQHGFDTQGGQHEGSRTRVVTNAVDYVSSFAVEGKLIKVNNLWKACDVYEDDDVVLSLRYVPPRPFAIPFNLSSSNRSHRTENAPAALGWWCLTPEVLLFKSIIDTPHIHIGRSQKMVTSYANPQFGNDNPQWNARASVGGTPLQMTFEPCYIDSDKFFFKRHMLYLRLDDKTDKDDSASHLEKLKAQAENTPTAAPLSSSVYKRPKLSSVTTGAPTPPSNTAASAFTNVMLTGEGPNEGNNDGGDLDASSASILDDSSIPTGRRSTTGGGSATTEKVKQKQGGGGGNTKPNKQTPPT